MSSRYSSGLFSSADVPGKTRSTPKGLSPTSFSIHSIDISSSSGVIQAAPSTPTPPAFVTAAITSRQCENAKMGSSAPSAATAAVFMLVHFLVSARGPGSDLVAPQEDDPEALL